MALIMQARKLTSLFDLLSVCAELILSLQMAMSHWNWTLFDILKLEHGQESLLRRAGDSVEVVKL